ncbi:secretion-regulating guanine nucleotide exchange factor isoform X2 [Nelusetta ayraudi]|uniref:secretion-regulating guanine nucleotide exchange factor isoform X2 n=1 Tax=Nelusetta ayraudi TaxID=303726 RepID=UPI003F716AE5
METNTPPELCLLSWGANSYGQLGQGDVEDRSDPRLCDAAAFKHKALRAVSGGGGHTAVVSEDGDVFVCGQNHRGQLGLSHSADVLTLQLCSGIGQRIVQVACGWDFSLFLTDCGRVLSCGSNAFGQLGVGTTVTQSADVNLVESLKEPVVSVAAGLRHSLAATHSGCVYQWGTGLTSHAKRALSLEPVPAHLGSVVPSLVPGLDQKMCRLVTAGSVHCVCLTGNGDLFVWGSNKHGQLAATNTFLPSPSLVKRTLLAGEKVTRVWSGWTHIVAQTESGKVLTWGRGDYGQLGRPASSSLEPADGGHQGNQAVPTELKDLQGATQIACGSEHNLAIVGTGQHRVETDCYSPCVECIRSTRACTGWYWNGSE